MSARAVIAAALGEHAARLAAHQEGLADGAQPRAIHQVRVALRRMRSNLDTFAPLCRGDWAPDLRKRSRQLADAVAEVRDRDVLLARLEGYREVAADPAVDRLATEVREELAPRRAAVVELAGSHRHATLIADLAAAATAPRLRRAADGPALELLVPLVISPWRIFHRALDKVGENTLDTELHAVRILAKRARYALAALVPAVAEAGPLARRVADLQDVLGDHQDACVARTWLGVRRDLVAAETVARLTSLEAERADEARSRVEAARVRVLDPQLRLWMLP